MGKSIIQHIDEAAWVYGGPYERDDLLEFGQQLIGDKEKGPWVYVNTLKAGIVIDPHSHSQDEVIYILDGEIKIEERFCGPGTVIYMQRDTDYGFTVGQDGVRFLNVRPGRDTYYELG